MEEAKGKGKKATSYDVARLAGVSQATVSLVLSGKATQFGITQETIARVRAAAEELSYYPNSLVRSIRRGRTGIVGVYGRDRKWSRHNSYWIEVLSALHTSAADMQQELLILSDHPNRPAEKLLERMLSGILDGLIVQPAQENEIIDRVATSRLPVVAIGDLYPGIPSISVDNVAGMELAVRHLAERGRKHVTFLNYAQVAFGAPKVREEAFLRAADELGVAGSLGAVRTDDPQVTDIRRIVDAGSDAIVAVNDDHATSAVRALLDLGIRIPEQVAVVGFDEISARFVPLRLTTIRSPIAQMCRLALERLLDVIEGRSVPEQTVLPVELVVGETT